MRVLAIPGIKVPLEHHPRAYITETAPEGGDAYEVEDTAYYLRRVADGDLIVINEVVKPGKGNK